MFFKAAEQDVVRVDDNTLRSVLSYGEDLMNTLVIFEKGMSDTQEIPLHQHAQVQTTYVLQGAFKFVIKTPNGIKEQIVFPGDSIYFPSDYPHGCIPLQDDSRLLDSFTPIRPDFL